MLILITLFDVQLNNYWFFFFILFIYLFFLKKSDIYLMLTYMEQCQLYHLGEGG